MISSQHLCWLLAAVVATRGLSLDHPRSRLALGLWLGLILAELGSIVFGSSWLSETSEPLLRTGGSSILFLPLGVLLVAPWREALAALPLALGVARLGCLPYDCCYASPWNAAPELAGWVALHFAARRWPRHAAPIVLCGFGAIRLLSLPLRRELLVDPIVDPAWIALAWIAAGVLLRDRIGSAEEAREWFTERTQPLLRTLVLMLVVWLLFPLAGDLFGGPGTALLLGSLAACILVVALRRPVLPRLSVKSPAVLMGTLLLGVGVAHVADLASSRFGFASLGSTQRSVGSAHALALVVLAPIFEELLYRERLLGVLRELWGWLPALLLSSVLFALAHPDPAVVPIAFAGGLVCGTVMLRTGSLAAVIGLHAGWNLGVLGVM